MDSILELGQEGFLLYWYARTPTGLLAHAWTGKKGELSVDSFSPKAKSCIRDAGERQ